MSNERKLMFYPWSDRVTNQYLKDYADNKIPVLDLDLSNRCNLGSCIYCDSQINIHNKDEFTFEELKTVVLQCKEFDLKSVYICGIGEPTDDDKFFPLIELLRDKEINCTIFTNGTFSTEKVRLLKDCNVNLILKMDTFKASSFNRILGKPETAEHIYKTLEVLLNSGYGTVNEFNETDLAFSIVPTKWTYKDIPEVVKFCVKNNIFPSIGELEYSGRAKDIYDDFYLNRNELENLKSTVESIVGHAYQRPICPAIVTGIHINNSGKVIVHRQTGLGCHWFLLSEPDMVEIGDIRIHTVEELNKNLRKFRREHFNQESLKIESKVPNVFGGCGGKLEAILDKYVEIQNEDKTYVNQ
jgi:MoaA/NifB/PqqE/SkfB family radical SAM enzyme